MLTILKQFSKISIKDLIICMQFHIIKINMCIISIIQFHLASLQIYIKTTYFLVQFTHLDTVIKIKFISKDWNLLLLPRNWQVLENGRITLQWQ